ncbi:MAG: secondary thiamine-phosphate synthase enzyme YjbQ [Patescibacteria group bacterium]
MKKIKISTNKKYELVNITNKIKEKISSDNSGIVTIFTPHSTAGILITEDEKNLKEDWINYFKQTLNGRNFLHDRIDNNAKSHLLSGLIGQEKTFIIDNGLIRGMWQQIFLAEFDGPRTREVLIQVIKQ